eukprot:m.49384 g.49384  ORF g.49384 m.49384 type:complete len:459 (-) comp8956_c0_seq3:404-1780(-)
MRLCFTLADSKRAESLSPSLPKTSTGVVCACMCGNRGGDKEKINGDGEVEGDLRVDLAVDNLVLDHQPVFAGLSADVDGTSEHDEEEESQARENQVVPPLERRGATAARPHGCTRIVPQHSRGRRRHLGGYSPLHNRRGHIGRGHRRRQPRECLKPRRGGGGRSRSTGVDGSGNVQPHGLLAQRPQKISVGDSGGGGGHHAARGAVYGGGVAKGPERGDGRGAGERWGRVHRHRDVHNVLQRPHLRPEFGGERGGERGERGAAEGPRGLSHPREDNAAGEGADVVPERPVGQHREGRDHIGAVWGQGDVDKAVGGHPKPRHNCGSRRRPKRPRDTDVDGRCHVSAKDNLAQKNLGDVGTLGVGGHPAGCHLILGHRGARGTDAADRVVHTVASSADVAPAGTGGAGQAGIRIERVDKLPRRAGLRCRGSPHARQHRRTEQRGGPRSMPVTRHCNGLRL